MVAPLIGEVRLSMIAGHGLFAPGAVAAGTPVLSFPDQVGSVDVLGPVNHSCEPTLGWSANSLVAMRDVPVGTELTTDYALFLDDAGYALPCHCETYRCRQMIEGDDWRIPQLQKRYDGWFAPHLAAQIAVP